jgi:Flp pilus assembly protein TadD
MPWRICFWPVTFCGADAGICGDVADGLMISQRGLEFMSMSENHQIAQQAEQLPVYSKATSSDLAEKTDTINAEGENISNTGEQHVSEPISGSTTGVGGEVSDDDCGNIQSASDLQDSMVQPAASTVAQRRPGNIRRSRRRLPFFLERLVNDLRLDDYHLLSWRQRWQHFLWLLGFDRFPFRERGWVFVFLIFVVATGALVASKPTRWDLYRKWRAQEHLTRAVAALDSGQTKTAQIHLRNAYRHTPENIDILQKWLATIPKNEPSQRIAILLQILEARPTGDTAAEVVDELLENQNIIQASSFATRQLTLHPDSWRLWFAAGKAYLMEKRFKVAREAFNRSAELAPDEKNVQFHLALVDVLMTPNHQSPDYSALESFQSVPELRKAAARTLTSLYLSTEPQRAVSMLDQIVAENPGEWEFQFLHFRMRLEKSADKAEADLWEDIWSRAVTFEQRLIVISEAVRHDLREKAENFMARLSDEDRKMASSRWIQMLTHITYKQWQDAKSVAKEALENDKLPTDWQLRFLAGMALVQQQMGNNRESIVFYNEASRRARDDPGLLFFLSELLLRLDLQDYARDSFERLAGTESPLKESALERLLGIYKSRMDWSGTFTTLERLNAVNPTNNSYIIQLASMLLVEKKMNHPLVRSLLESDIKQLPLQSEALELVAHACAQAGHSGKASLALRLLENKQPSDSPRSIHRIATLAYLGRKHDAANAYAQMLSNGPQIHELEKKYLEEIIGG